MSVYTQLNNHEFASFLANYQIGSLKSFNGIEAGVTNTIYYIETSQSKFILTIFEELDHTELPFYLELLDFLAHRDLPSARVIRDKYNNKIMTLKFKPAVLMEFLAGEVISIINPAHCAAIGAALAEFHLAALEFSLQQQSSRDLIWHQATAAKLHPLLDDSETKLLKNEMHLAEKFSLATLPQGIIHADLFRDNVLFENDKLSGLIDFYYACNGALSYDLAVVVNDWCFDETDNFLADNYTSLMSAYTKIRPLQQNEQDHWPHTLRQAALRFWLSRLHDFHLGPSGKLIQKKNPDTFRKRLEFW